MSFSNIFHLRWKFIFLADTPKIRLVSNIFPELIYFLESLGSVSLIKNNNTKAMTRDSGAISKATR